MQTTQMPILIGVFAGGSSNFVGICGALTHVKTTAAATYLLSHILEKVTNSINLIICFEIAMQLNPWHLNVTMQMKLEINTCTVWPVFRFFKNVILEILLQEIKFPKSC